MYPPFKKNVNINHAIITHKATHFNYMNKMSRLSIRKFRVLQTHIFLFPEATEFLPSF